MSQDPAESSIVARSFATVGGLLFAGSLVLLGVLFVGRYGDDAGEWSWGRGWRPAAIDIALFSVFALHHSVFARSGLKRRVHRVAPPALERSLYVWVASLLLAATCWLWQPVPGRLWDVTGPARLLLNGLQVLGAILSLAAASGLDTLALAGIRQVFDTTPASDVPRLDDRGPFALVRHPIYLGWFLAFWPAATMNGTRFVFVATSCAYLVLAIPFEERDLRRTFGVAYEAYARKVRWRLIPWLY